MSKITFIKRPIFIPLACIFGLIFTLNMISQGEQKVAVPKKKKIVFVAGKPSHKAGEHEHRAGCMLLADHLNQSGLPIEAVVTTNGWPQDESIFENASSVIIYSDGGNGHPAIKKLENLKRLAASGIGIGCIHYAVEIPNGDPGNALRDLIGGYFETDWSVNPHWEASFQLPKHPITRGVKNFKMNDEWYYHMRFQENMVGITPILSDLPSAKTLSRPDGKHSGNPSVRAAVLERKEPQHLMWAYERPESLGQGRSFGFTGGHYHKNWQQDDMRRVVLNAAMWISGIEIPEDGVTSKTPTDEEMAANLDPK
jgi:type 1 glutamine amidotransferase